MNFENVIYSFGKTIELESGINEYELLGLPRGKFYIERYNKTLNFNDDLFKKVADAFDNAKITKPFIDMNHDLGRSYGDILNYRIAPEGMIFKVSLTDEGKKLIEERAYKYYSPSFGSCRDTTGKNWEYCLFAISLTNNPALEANIKSLQEQFNLEDKKENIIVLDLSNATALQDNAGAMEVSMDEIMKAYEAFKMAVDNAMKDESTDKEQLKTEIATKLKELAGLVGLATAENAPAEETKMSCGTTEEKNMSRISKLEAEKIELQKSKDDVTKQLLELSNKVENLNRKNIIDEFKKDYLGKKLTPNSFELMKDQIVRDPENSRKIIESLPSLELTSEIGGNGVDTNFKLEKEDRLIMQDNGLDPSKPEDVKKYETLTK